MFNLNNPDLNTYFQVQPGSSLIAHMRWQREHPGASLKESMAERKRLREVNHQQHLAMKGANLPTKHFKVRDEAVAYAGKVEATCGFKPEITEVSFL